MINELEASGNILSSIIHFLFRRRKRINNMLEKWENEDRRIDGIFSFADKVTELDQKVAVVHGKLETIENTINTIFLIVDRSLGRKKNKVVKVDRRK